MRIYAFSGLGTDGRIFSHLSLDHEVVPVNWIEPERSESLSKYALRLEQQIDQSEPFALLGVSFGGMIASELAKTMIPAKTMLISSAATKHELPWMATVSRTFRLHDFLPAIIYRPPTWTTYLNFPTNKKHREVARGIIRDMDTTFIKWALGAIVKWENEKVPDDMVHIHGRLDPIIPYKNRMNAEVVGRGHFIILKNAEEVSKRINQLLI